MNVFVRLGYHGAWEDRYILGVVDYLVIVWEAEPVGMLFLRRG